MLAAKKSGKCPAKVPGMGMLQLFCFQRSRRQSEGLFAQNSRNLADLSQGWWFSATRVLQAVSRFTAPANISLKILACISEFGDRKIP
jgi:hypothetical protein